MILIVICKLGCALNARPLTNFLLVFSRWISWVLHVSREDGADMTAHTSAMLQTVWPRVIALNKQTNIESQLKRSYTALQIWALKFKSQLSSNEIFQINLESKIVSLF